MLYREATEPEGQQRLGTMSNERPMKPVPRRAASAAACLFWSTHAQSRRRQRAIPAAAVLAALDWGDAYHLGKGKMAFYLGRRATRRAAEQGVDVGRSINTLVVIGDGETVVTAYRTERCRFLHKRRVR